MKTLSFEETKEIELSILFCFHDFCEKNGLKYFLAYGTLLGAIRHEGFIPWDDDVDVQMPRDDYNKLISMFNLQNENSHLRLISTEDPISRHSFVKIIDSRTLKIEEGVDYKNGFLGVDIDVFPIDGQPENEADFEKWYNKLKKIYSRCNFCVLKNEGSLKKRLALPVIKFFSNPKRLRKKAEKLHALYPYSTSKYVGTIEAYFNLKGNRIDRSCYEECVTVPFEGHTLKAPKGYDAILTKLYGDYMQLPPKEHQVTHHLNNCHLKD